MLSASIYAYVKFLKVITSVFDLWLIDLIKHETGNFPFLNPNCENASELHLNMTLTVLLNYLKFTLL